ncbi:ABC transporter permease [Streptomyces bauhiniae]|uniref:ABC transporter permease subunit n=1 Tax=Streptomyces bauhiniae TaxID=2340725 RepID=A0A7K3QJX3_9ACTN|nr:ABC transporter permease subunit [Streptomyces bauhiniae]
MSTLTAATETPPTASGRPAYRVTGRRVVASEWAKLFSLRSSWIVLALSLLFVVGFGLIAALRYRSEIGSGQMDPDFARQNAVGLSLFGTNFAQLVLGVLGVLVTAGEYSTGMIRSTLAAVPRRLPVLWSKAAVTGLVALVVATIGAFVAFLLGSRVVAGTPGAIGFAHQGVVRSLLGAGLYLGLVAVIGTALGALLRSVAGAISALVAGLMLIPGLITLLPSAWHDGISPYLPSNAGASMFAVTRDPATLTPGMGLLVLLAWTALTLAAAAYRLRRADA